MKRIIKVLKVTGLIIASFIVIAIISYLFVSYNIEKQADKTYAFNRDTLQINSTIELTEQGRHLVKIKGCTDCHGENLKGKIFVDDKSLGTISASNLTKGKGGIGSYSTADWMMALRHGINRNGKPLLIMPSQETALLSKEDLRAIISYCESVPATDNVLPENNIGPLVKVLTFLDKMPLFSVDKIDHSLKPFEAAPKLTGIELGKYLSVSCAGCHKQNMRGGEAVIPGAPPFPNITSSGAVGKWNLKQFEAVLTTGKTPEGKLLDNNNMPWKMTANYSEKEIESLYLYLQSIQ